MTVWRAGHREKALSDMATREVGSTTLTRLEFPKTKRRDKDGNKKYLTIYYTYIHTYILSIYIHTVTKEVSETYHHPGQEDYLQTIPAP